MGHPSDFLIEKTLGKSSLIKHESNKLCFVCLRAKQTHDIFPLSPNNASEIFDLITVICGIPIILLLHVVNYISLLFWTII